MAQKCVHKGCGKTYTDAEETCIYHPGPPIFHEGQKGWKCCKPRVLTFDEFLSIAPCTEGKHSTTDLPPEIEKRAGDAATAEETLAKLANSQSQAEADDRPKRGPISASAQATPAPPPAPPESEDDEPSLVIPEGKACRRTGCKAVYKTGQVRSDDEQCVHHPGLPLFHEGSKGYVCCKRRVLEFDEFMKIEGCKTSPRHLFIGSGKDKKNKNSNTTESGLVDGEELLDTVRSDFYQTPSNVIASFFLKKIDKAKASIVMETQTLVLDLPTTDSTPKRYRSKVPLFGPIDPAKSSFQVLGSKLEVNLAKADGASWPVLRSDDARTGEILQIGKAGRV